jgi:hypothetical protein
MFYTFGMFFMSQFDHGIHWRYLSLGNTGDISYTLAFRTVFSSLRLSQNGYIARAAVYGLEGEE